MTRIVRIAAALSDAPPLVAGGTAPRRSDGEVDWSALAWLAHQAGTRAGDLSSSASSTEAREILLSHYGIDAQDAERIEQWGREVQASQRAPYILGRLVVEAMRLRQARLSLSNDTCIAGRDARAELAVGARGQRGQSLDGSDGPLARLGRRGKGNPQVRRRFPGVPPIARRVPAEHVRNVTAILDALLDDEQLDSLKAFQSGALSWQELLVAKRKARLTDDYLLERIKLEQPLWESLRSASEQLGISNATRERYRWSIEKLKRVCQLRESAKLRELPRVPWLELRRTWEESPSEWMRLRQMVGATLTVILGDLHHPFRRRVMKAIPRMKEEPRVVELAVDEFWELVGALPPQAQPAIVCLAATGFRLGEYLSCRKEHLSPSTRAIRNPRGKTGADVVYVAESLWPWIEAAVPAPLQVRWLRIHFHRARRKIGKHGLTLHDLRHVYGQLAADQGVHQSKIQAAMRHETAAMTARYLARVAKREVAEAVGDALGNGAPLLPG